jgi:hypothetical protein
MATHGMVSQISNRQPYIIQSEIQYNHRSGNATTVEIRIPFHFVPAYFVILQRTLLFYSTVQYLVPVLVAGTVVTRYTMVELCGKL